MAASEAGELVMLKGGLVVPVPPLRLLWQLEERGLTVSRDGDYLLVQPHQQLTLEDCAQIRRWKPQLLALVEYRPAGAM